MKRRHYSAAIKARDGSRAGGAGKGIPPAAPKMKVSLVFPQAVGHRKMLGETVPGGSCGAGVSLASGERRGLRLRGPHVVRSPLFSLSPPAILFPFSFFSVFPSPLPSGQLLFLFPAVPNKCSSDTTLASCGFISFLAIHRKRTPRCFPLWSSWEWEFSRVI